MTDDGVGEVRKVTDQLLIRSVAAGLFEMTGVDSTGVQSWIVDVADLQRLVDRLVESLRSGDALDGRLGLEDQL
ncbi:hypothetical protein SAMN05660657_04295 [Geodermatophilus amargosae]|uniref:Uncharacterized protein n=1 Tax=Geodermatophilus amargosae TaxID=1296565 RepID=A0A1I7CBW3_9ACTN|nr:hypothetical protein [Geodermatophilus amargosae]SFT96896.1 hypothetical protein SAMN05660657_04295 [Geodermatophilus amargosae]